MQRRLDFGISPCPNDTFIFGGLALERVPCAAGEPVFHLADVEELNRWAATGEPAVCKVSVAAAADLLDRYVILRAGGALGWGVGPLLVASKPAQASLNKLCGSVAVPGMRTTATLLFCMLAREKALDVTLQEMIYHQVMPVVASGECSAGLVIHEGRFVLQQHGLVALQDMGEWWEQRTGLPLPLGCIVARRDLGNERLHALNTAIQRSLAYADGAEDVWSYIREHAQEMDESVIKQHVRTFVTDYSRDLGTEGEEALGTLLREAVRLRGCSLHTLPWILPA
ncbi:1,4-dihydroxy-6-naphthoate synthase [Paucidesulfovibrio gracilis DSM 16080]|uniref:1,4-dihydroxy-6-naphtoate synthase n=1 Tax=Paucidesulfovibrio gracilis DSM 16080 TaxID=1121449 RepID=A0A1T4WDT1_9BACT|nr:1,4-dihydroxy-6-naphthoate synthase [Paucidesulfovibrio gracilis]SKA74811.1 1,4-dihydroxy-6-naphthoate synthase [Paucidesulfovibrio gracilis DSM 16080]